ncbi:TIGR03617 family F420-dependent LLM class oxidoreductase [Nonomuraea jabiensis]|uniref:TIGR03617 family F420-dependent LLM class oxidoreductase n=1 Tax=Nonomuraea jabiensis TaxID=882448 RepID=UPI00341E89BD
MKFDLNLVSAAIQDMPASVRDADQSGFDGVFVAETTQDPFLALAAAAAVGRDIDLGTSVALAFPRSPMITAVAAWELQRASHGRFLLGLGSQVRKHIERRFSTAFERPAARLREYVLALRHIWECFDGQHPCEFHGEFYRFDFLPDAVKPAPLRHEFPRVHLAAFGPTMYRTAGAVASGAFVHPVHTVDYLRTVAEPAIAEGLAKADRDRSAFELCVSVLPIVGTGEHGHTAQQRAREQLAFYCSTPNYRRVLELHGWQNVGAQLQAMVRNGRSDRAAAAVPDEMLDLFCITADTWPEAVQRARTRYAGIADRLSFYYPPPAGVRIQ